MLVTVVEIGLLALGAYLAVGFAMALALHLGGLLRIDPATGGAGLGFRLLITPGLVALWPLMVARWRRAAAGASGGNRPADTVVLRRRHLRIVSALFVVVPVLAAVGLFARPATPGLDPAARATVPEPAALPELRLVSSAPFAGLPVEAAIRGDTSGALQLELVVARDLEIPGLLGFWRAPGSAQGAVFLGAVWGPGTRRYELPPEAAGDGEVTLYSTGHRERVATWRYEVWGTPRPASGEQSGLAPGGR